MRRHLLIALAATVALALAGCGDEGEELKDKPQIETDRTALFFDVFTNTQPVLTLKITNKGKQDLVISDVVLGGTDASRFSHTIDKNTVKSTEDAFVQVVYTSPATPASHAAELTITSNAENSPKLVVPITARAVAPSP